MSKIKICLDAGHGGKDSGAVLGKRYEKDDALKIVNRLGKVLKANDIEVSYTRTTDTYDSPSTKAKKGNSYNADYFISIHRNAAGSMIASGVETLVCNSKDKKYEMAKNITNRLVKRGFKDRGVKLRTDLAVLNQTRMPALLIEVGFITNKQDNALLDDKFYPIVNDIARGIMITLGLEFKTLTELKK